MRVARAVRRPVAGAAEIDRSARGDRRRVALDSAHRSTLRDGARDVDGDAPGRARGARGMRARDVARARPDARARRGRRRLGKATRFEERWTRSPSRRFARSVASRATSRGTRTRGPRGFREDRARTWRWSWCTIR